MRRLTHLEKPVGNHRDVGSYQKDHIRSESQESHYQGWAFPNKPKKRVLKSRFKHVFYSQKPRKKHNRREIRDTAPEGRQIKNIN
jgi:hypothetical protein